MNRLKYWIFKTDLPYLLKGYTEKVGFYVRKPRGDNETLEIYMTIVDPDNDDSKSCKDKTKRNLRSGISRRDRK